MTTILKIDAVTEALNKAIAEKGEDYVYPNYESQCYYAERNEVGEVAPSCIVGWVVDLIDHEALERAARYETDEEESFGVPELEYYAGVRFESGALRQALEAAQRVQDGGAPWSYAKRAYELVLNEDVMSYEASEQILGEWRIEKRRREEAGQ